MKWEPAEAKMESQISSVNESCEKKKTVLFHTLTIFQA